MFELRDNDKTLKFRGVFGVISMMLWPAVNIEDAVQANVRDAGVEKGWKPYSSR